jgi:predicted DNA-binding transcriptional regulator YafY
MPNYNFSRLEYLDNLIRLKATGDPKTLAKKLNISVRAVYDYINTLKAQGAPINYNRHKETYYYDEQGHFCFKFMRTESKYP